MSMRRMWSRAWVGGLCLAAAMATGCGSLAGLGQGAGASALDALGRKGQRTGDFEWTVFVYVAGDNNLSQAADWNLNQMEAAYGSDKVKIVAFVDQEGKGNARIHEIVRDPGGLNDKIVSPVVDDGGAVIPRGTHEVDSGKVETLDNFVRWASKKYQGHRSMLVLWNHGGSAFTHPEHLKSFCWDDEANNGIHLNQLYSVFNRFNTVQKFEITGFDTCLLGHLETAYQLKNLSQFVVASEKTEPGAGWNYEGWVKALSAQPSMSPRTLAGHIVQSFGNFYKENPDMGPTTLSALDVEKLSDRLAPAVNQLGASLIKDLANPAARAAMTNTFDQVATLTANEEQGEVDALDLGYMARRLATLTPGLSDATKEAAKAVQMEVGRTVVANRTTQVKDAFYTGTKIYFGATGYNQMYASLNQRFGMGTWGEFVKAYAATKADKNPIPASARGRKRVNRR